MQELRQLAGSIITSQPVKYSSAILGKPIDEYVQWILKDESWGGTLVTNVADSYCTLGAIELLVFSEFYQIELDVVDIQTLRLDRFGKLHF